MRITVQFHPDWPFGGDTVIESMARDRRYRNQFETGISNGGLTARRGGDRWRWESRLFAGRYDHGPAAARPVYGALNHRDRPHGGSIRFGSAFLRLSADTMSRATFCFPDSAFEPDSIGDVGMLPDLVAAADAAGHDVLDDYVEAHVHGGVHFESDVEAIVLDPVFAGTRVERAARDLDCAVEFHPGLRVATSELDPDYRGQAYVALAQSLSAELTPDVIGRAARTGRYDPQSLKRVWHYLARYGQL